MTMSFPRQEARTRRYTLGVPRAFRVCPDGTRVAYLRTQDGSDPVTCLWVLDVDRGTERLVARRFHAIVSTCGTPRVNRTRGAGGGLHASESHTTRPCLVTTMCTEPGP